MTAYRVVAFDCDGVMFDSRQANIAFYNRILEHLQRPPLTDSQFAYTHMHTVDEALAFLFPEPGQQAAAQAYRRQMSYHPYIRYMQIEPHLKPLLKRLRPRFKTAVATNRTDTMNRVLSTHGLADQFDLVVSALDVGRPKPHPDCLLKILSHFQIAPAQAIYVGDSQLDEHACRAAAIPFVAYGNRRLTADYHIDSLKELETILELAPAV